MFPLASACSASSLSFSSFFATSSGGRWRYLNRYPSPSVEITSWWSSEIAQQVTSCLRRWGSSLATQSPPLASYTKTWPPELPHAM